MISNKSMQTLSYDGTLVQSILMTSITGITDSHNLTNFVTAEKLIKH